MCIRRGYPTTTEHFELGIAQGMGWKNAAGVGYEYDPVHNCTGLFHWSCGGCQVGHGYISGSGIGYWWAGSDDMAMSGYGDGEADGTGYEHGGGDG